MFFPSLLLWVGCFKRAFLVIFLTIHNHHRIDPYTWVIAFHKKPEKLMFLPLKISLSKQYQSWLFHSLCCIVLWHLLSYFASWLVRRWHRMKWTEKLLSFSCLLFPAERSSSKKYGFFPEVVRMVIFQCALQCRRTYTGKQRLLSLVDHVKIFTGDDNVTQGKPTTTWTWNAAIGRPQTVTLC